ncbi:anthranilate synthase component I [Hyphobacterium marinum]|uniref:Anthranilate synthase component 1 n=1 Tax=Hyphobacterium marinum TaxID=3116574 RepID=A0ABU7M163_9PROT|nr:anthranilate synthase component I [Hyphobacterium sp. Y6023]MEE2567515.1 anthranilate synthase component I [Hyphobacterium sp. Y6023]
MITLEPSLEACRERKAGNGVLLRASRADDLTTPVAAFLALAQDRDNAFLLESVEGGTWRGRYSAIGLDPDFVWTVRDGEAFILDGEDLAAGKEVSDGTDLLASLRRAMAAARLDLPVGVPPIASGLFGYLGYDMVRAVERLPGNAPDPLGLPQARLIRPRIVAVFDALKQDVTVYAPLRPGEEGLEAAYAETERQIRSVFEQLDAPHSRRTEPANPDPAEPVSNTEPDAFRAGVETLRDHIRAGDIFQGVLSQRFTLDFPHPPFALYRALRRLNPSPFLFHFQFSGFAVTGSSPEILVRLQDGTVTVRPIAGTRARGATPAEDDHLEADLLADPKERAEHLMLLDLGRNDVGRVARPGSVRVTEREIVERYSHVMHIVSNVEGEIADGKDAVSALFAGFPAGTVSGAPKVRAMEILDAAEPHQRGIYAGAVGYFSANGDMDTCIALRTAVTKDGQMHVQAGAGVVLDSDPEAERQETLNKAKALLRAAGEAHRFT